MRQSGRVEDREEQIEVILFVPILNLAGPGVTAASGMHVAS
jgi:hypothetical protein